MATTSEASPDTSALNQPLEQIHQIAQWFEAAVPNPTPQNALVQFGVHFEEVFEMVRAMEGSGATREANEQLNFAADVLSYFQRQIKSGNLVIDFNKLDRVALLDALCDQIVTAVGVAHMLGMDIEGALKEVAVSNDSKFGENGSPIFDDQQKIMKGPRYQSPNIAAFTTKGVMRNV